MSTTFPAPTSSRFRYIVTLRRRDVICALLTMSILTLGKSAADAQTATLDTFLGPVGGPTWSRIVQLATVMSALSLAPGLLMMVTSFPRIVIVFSFLRAGLGMPSTPNNAILVGLALFLTAFIMAPTLDAAWQNGLKPLGENRIKPEDAFERTAAPFKAFMRANTREKDTRLFNSIAADRLRVPSSALQDDLRVIVPAFVVSELRRGFEIGFLIVLPFLIIDLVVSTVVMSMGMMMLSPQAFSLPLKALFFVMIDGWALLVGSLARSFV